MTTATDEAVTAAKNAPQLLTILEDVNPALYAQLLGSAATYSKSAAAPVVGVAVGALVARFGLACTATVTTACWTQGTVDTVTDLCVAAGAALGALVMHWISKAPARAVAAPSSPAAP